MKVLKVKSQAIIPQGSKEGTAAHSWHGIVTLFYNERHPKPHAKARPKDDTEDNNLNPTRQHASSLEEPEKQDETSKKNI